MTAYNVLYASQAKQSSDAIRRAKTDLQYHSKQDAAILKEDAMGEDAPWTVELLVVLNDADDPESAFVTAESWERAAAIPVGETA